MSEQPKNKRKRRSHSRFGSLGQARKARDAAKIAKDRGAVGGGVLKNLGQENPSAERDAKGRSTTFDKEFWDEQRPPHWG